LDDMRVDLVIPVYNEEEALASFHEQLCAAVHSLPCDLHIFYVNDGSSDATNARLENICQTDQRVTVLELSRNFGHQAALTAGLDQAEGDYVISLDGDGQHPPERIGEMLQLAQSGYDVVIMQRVDEGEVTAFKRRTSSLFYRLLNWIGSTRVAPGAADFRLMAKPVVQALRGMREYHRFLRGMVAWIGFKTVILPYRQPQRIAGRSKYSLRKMVRLATDAMFSFSLVPLYIAISLGALFLVGAVLEGIYVLSFWVTGNIAQLAPGWSSLMFVLLIVGGSLMIAIGLIGIYIGFIFQEVKGRPIYLVRRRLSRAADEPPADSAGAAG
jgi:glycosyltransferase involved in cell wall biosynthesis